MSTIWAFDDFELDVHARQLRKAGASLVLGARAFDLLAVLVGYAGQTVTKQKLFARVWPNLVVEDNNLQVHVSTLRKLLGADAITTVAGQGYCFTRRVQTLAVEDAALADPASTKTALEAQGAVAPAVQPTNAMTASVVLPPVDRAASDGLSLRRSVAVLPFTNVGGGKDDEYFSDGLAEDVITHLSRSRWLFVTPRNSSFSYRGDAVPAKQVAHELGVRYVVYGTVRRLGPRLRVTVELVDGTQGDTLWANRYDRMADDLFAVQDEISSSITSAIEPIYLKHEEIRAHERPVHELARWDVLMKARWHFWRSGTWHVEQARLLLTKLLEQHPTDAPAISLLAFVLLNRVWSGRAENPRQELEEAFRLAQIAVRNDGEDAYAHLTLGTVMSVKGDNARAIESFKTALQIYPQFAAAAGELARVYAFSGRSDEAHEYALQALDASPHDPHASLWLRTRAVAEFVRQDYSCALRYARQAAAKRSDWYFNHYLVAACEAACGDVESSKASFALASPSGKYTMQAMRFGHPFAREDDLNRFAAALKQAGWVV